VACAATGRAITSIAAFEIFTRGMWRRKAIRILKAAPSFPLSGFHEAALRDEADYFSKVLSICQN
jgi:hypothetical protein